MSAVVAALTLSDSMVSACSGVRCTAAAHGKARRPVNVTLAETRGWDVA